MYRVVRFRACAIASLAVTAALFILASCAQDAQENEETHSDATAQMALIERLQTDVAYLKDRQQIHDVYMRYMRGFDRNDVELMRGAFWPDVQINYGKQSYTFDEFVVRHLHQHIETMKAWGHLLTNQSVDLNGDVAHVEVTVTRLSSSKKDSKSMIISGRYIDRLDRRNGEWRIAMREFVPHFVTETDTALDAYVKTGWAQSACAMGTWDKHDPSYRRPLTARTDKSIGPACAK